MKPALRMNLAVLAGLLFILAPVLSASEEGGREAPGGGLQMIGKVINFLVLFGGLAFILAKPLRALLRGRTEAARRAIEESEARLREAEARTRAGRERLAGLEAEVLALKRAAEEQGRTEQERIRSLAREEAEKIRRLTRQELDARVRAAVAELRRHAASLAAERALGRLKARMSGDLRSRLVDRSLDALAKHHEQTSARP